MTISSAVSDAIATVTDTECTDVFRSMLPAELCVEGKSSIPPPDRVFVVDQPGRQPSLLSTHMLPRDDEETVHHNSDPSDVLRAGDPSFLLSSAITSTKSDQFPAPLAPSTSPSSVPLFPSISSSLISHCQARSPQPTKTNLPPRLRRQLFDALSELSLRFHRAVPLSLPAYNVQHASSVSLQNSLTVAVSSSFSVVPALLSILTCLDME